MLKFGVFLTVFLVKNSACSHLLPVEIPEEAALDGLAVKNRPGFNPPAQKCSDVNLQFCQSTFNTALGIKGNADWSNPMILIQQINALYMNNGTQGFLAVCNAYQKLSKCLGPQYYSCLSILHFLAKGYSYRNSHLYIEVMHQFHFECGGGLETFVYNIACINKAVNKNNATFWQCYQTYHNNIQKNPSKICTYLSQYIACVRAPFKQSCNAQSSWWECENVRSAVSIILPQCNNIRCYVGSSTKEEEEEEDSRNPGRQTNEKEKEL